VTPGQAALCVQIKDAKSPQKHPKKPALWGHAARKTATTSKNTSKNRVYLRIAERMLQKKIRYPLFIETILDWQQDVQKE